MNMKRILALTAPLLLLVSCTEQKLYEVSPQPVVQPVVPVQLPNPLNLPGKDQPTYVNPYPAGTHEHFAARKEYPRTLDHWADDTLLHQVTRANSKLAALRWTGPSPLAPTATRPPRAYSASLKRTRTTSPAATASSSMPAAK